MGNIITQATNNATSYGVDDKGNLSMNANSTFTAQTGIFNKGVQFNGDIDAKGSATFTKGVTFNGNITAKLINDVDIGALNTSVSRLSTGVGAGSFTGTVTATSFTGESATFDSVNADKIKFKTKLESNRRIIVDDTKFYGGSDINFINGITFQNTGSNGLTVATGSNALFNGGLTVATGSNALFNGGLTVATGSNALFNGGLTVSGPTGATFNGLIAESGVFRGLSLTGGTGTVSMADYSLSAGTGTFSGLISANAGVSLPTGASFNLFGSMSGTGNITTTGIGSFGSLTSSSMISANGGLTVSGSTGARFNGLTAESGVFRSLSLTGGSGNVNMTGYTLNAGTGVFGGLSLTGGTGTVSMTGYSLFAGTGTFSGLSLIGGTGSVNMTGYTLNAGTGFFRGLSLTGGSGNVNMAGYTLNAGTGVFGGLSLTGGTGTVSMNGYSLSAGTGTFSGLIYANGGVSLPTRSIFTLAGNMTGTGNINVGNAILSGSLSAQSTNVTSLTSNNMISADGGIQIGTSANKWQIKESNGGTATGLLCFARGGSTTPYACIDTSGNLIAGTGYTVAP